MDRFATDRAQTGIDYVIGAGVFLITITFIVGFVPGMLQPFTTDEADVVLADRTASQLAESTLGSADDPYVLDADCTEGFFRQLDGGAAATGCNFPSGATDLQDVTNIDDTTGMNVTIEDTGGITSIDGRRLRAGQDPTGIDTVTVAQRTVYVDGRTLKIYVRVW